MKKPQKNRIKFRRNWGEMSPVTKVRASKKIYSRKFKTKSPFEDSVEYHQSFV